MAEAQAPTKAAEVLKGFDERIKAGDEKIKTLTEGLEQRNKAFELQTKELGELKEKVAKIPDYGMAGIVGAIPKDSSEYSVIKAMRYASGHDLSGENAKYEVDCSNKLAEIYKSYGFQQHEEAGMFRRMMVPFSTSYIPRENDKAVRFVAELRQKMVAGADRVDEDEVNWLNRRMGRPMVTKASIGTVSDTAGGVLVGFPTLGELIDIQRNIEAFAQAGATEIALPPNGRIQYPKLTNAATAFWVGEAATITSSIPSTGYLDLQAKKLGVLVDINNELIRFGQISAEAMVRTDMAKVAALLMDLAELQGTGGTQIKGIINYPSAATWTFGTDTLTAYTVTSNLIQIKDAAEMEALLPDTAGEPTAWIMRRQLWSKIRNRRGDAATAADAAGPFLADIIRTTAERIPLQWDGTKVVRTSQVSATRGSGSQTYALLGHFPDWITARFGALEFLSSMVGDTQMTTDQTRIRCIQHVDAGPRHASSFIFADAINIA